MKFLIDEDASNKLPLLKSHLQEKGHDVIAQAEIAPGAPDLDVLALATQQSRTIITFDGHFSAHRFRDNRPIPYGVIFIEASKHKVDRNDVLMTRKITSAIETIVISAANNPDILCDTIFTLTQPTPYVNTRIRPKRHPNKKEVVNQVAYFEEQLFASSEFTWVSIPLEAEESENG